MADILLSWHGAITCWQDGRLFPARPEDVSSGKTMPLRLVNGRLAAEPSPPLTILPIDRAGPVPFLAPVIALRAGPLHVSCRHGATFRAVEQCAEWEHFLCLPEESLPTLAAALQSNWRLETGQALRPRLEEFFFTLGEHRADPRKLSLSSDGLVLGLAPGHLAQKWPNAAFDRAIGSVIIALETLKSDHKKDHAAQPWLDDLPRQLLLTTTDETEYRHLFFLARLCLLAGLNEEASLCLTALQGSFYEMERLLLASIQARSVQNEARCKETLMAAIKHAVRNQDDASSVLTWLEKRLESPFCLAALWPELEKRTHRTLDPAFDDLLLPGWLPPGSDLRSRLIYFNRLEEKWTQCPADRRQQFIDLEKRLNGPSHALALLEGHRAWLEGDRKTANTHYDQARTLSLRDKLPFMHFNSGVYSWQTQNNRQTDPHPLSVAAWRWHGLPEKNTASELILVAGCDRGYFSFLPRLVASLIQACEAPTQQTETPSPGTIRLVLGVADGTNEQIAFLTSVSDALRRSGSPVALSFAWGTLSHRDGASYSCIRYLLLPRICRALRGPVMTIDSDAMIPADFLSLTHALHADFDYGFRLYAYDRNGRQQAGEPWGFGAGVSYFGEPERLPVIAQDLHDYIVTAYHAANPTNWCVDQCALAAIYHRHIAPDWSALRIRFMDDPPPIILMPHHLGMDKRTFNRWEGVVSMAPIYERLGVDAGIAEALGRFS